MSFLSCAFAHAHTSPLSSSMRGHGAAPNAWRGYISARASALRAFAFADNGTVMTLALPALGIPRKHKIDLSWPILVLFAALLCVLIILPMSWLIYYSLVDRSGAFTLNNFRTLVTDPVFVDPLMTTLIL